METSRRVEAVRRNYLIVETLMRHDEMRITELAAKTGLSKSVAHAHLNTLYDMEYVVKDGSKYRLGLKYLALSEQIKAHVENFDEIVDAVDEVATETGEAVRFAKEEHGHLIYLYEAVGGNALSLPFTVGQSEDVHSTAMGKVLLAQYPAERVTAILDGVEFEAKTENTIADREAFRDELDKVAEKGYAVDREENTEGVRRLAVPITTGGDAPLGAISILGPAHRFADDSTEADLVDDLLQAANVVEVNARFS